MTDGTGKLRRSSIMSFGESMIIMISFHPLNHRGFKNFYIGFKLHLLINHRGKVLSYNLPVRFLHKSGTGVRSFVLPRLMMQSH